MAAWYGRAVALGDARELLDELGVLEPALFLMAASVSVGAT